MEYHNILVPTDGSVYSEVAVSRAIEIAKTSQAKLTALYVVSHFIEVGSEFRELMAGLTKVLEEQGRRALAKAKELAEKEGVKIETVIEYGEPSEKILEVAREGKFDLIVIGSKGRTGVNKFLMGSTSQRVVRRAHCTVMVARKEK